MGDRILTLKDCPKCGGKLECYQQDSAELKVDSCLECGYLVNYTYKTKVYDEG